MQDEIAGELGNYTIVFQSGAIVNLEEVTLSIKVSGAAGNPRQYVFKKENLFISYTPHFLIIY